LPEPIFCQLNHPVPAPSTLIVSVNSEGFRQNVTALFFSIVRLIRTRKPTLSSINMQIARFPRINLTNLPTPLQEMRRLTKKLDGPRLLVKRDDLTGLAMGGNKTRKLEFIRADAKSKGADVIVTGAGLQSNWSTLTTAAAARCGMKTVICSAGPTDGYKPEEYGGNMLLQKILGAEIRVFPVPTVELYEKVLTEVADELKAKGNHPYVANFAGSTPIGCLGYVQAMIELINQATSQDFDIDYVLTACGSRGTQAGLISGAKTMRSHIKVIGINVMSDQEEGTLIRRLVSETTKLLDQQLDLNSEDIIVLNDYAGESYGAIHKDAIDAITLVAQTEGIFLDPVYTGKAMAGLVDLVKRGHFNKNDTVVFLHTGGTPAIFPYKHPIKAILEMKTPPWIKPPWGQP
jgi:L-cysteate sulfo-lyase